MKPDDELCLCFHVTRRKVEQYLRVHQPDRVSQLSDCFGAGTGCGWCRPFLQRLFDASRVNEQTDALALPDAADYLSSRAIYRKKSQQDREQA